MTVSDAVHALLFDVFGGFMTYALLRLAGMSDKPEARDAAMRAVGMSLASV